ncbi:Mitogen-activated protein kinase [Heracleum sosnowskyi]|uniref:Mitogen-activated protein kinase n=1 Tax=Heracleum sosnowskyi TaxID=360622 RepID=A0AAD8J518_9APIA|nr:Mitogen-activated protein kinase [Heracleum sosnowskyi]
MLCSFFRNSLFIDVLVDIGVVFTRRSDAFQALKKYNNVQLDGKPMKIEIAGAISDIPVLARGNVVGVVNGKRTVVMKSGIIRGRGSSAFGRNNGYQIQEVVGKGSYGVVGSVVDNHTGEKVAIKKNNDVFDHVSDATRILREIKLLGLLKHPNIVEIKHIMLPPSRREFKDIYIAFELMESDLHQVIRANNDLTPEHHQFFLYQLLRSLKYMHSANVFHRDLKPKNILANSDWKLKICDFGLDSDLFMK